MGAVVKEGVLDGVLEVLCTRVVVSGSGVERGVERLKVPGHGTQFQLCGPDVWVLEHTAIHSQRCSWSQMCSEVRVRVARLENDCLEDVKDPWLWRWTFPRRASQRVSECLKKKRMRPRGANLPAPLYSAAKRLIEVLPPPSLKGLNLYPSWTTSVWEGRGVSAEATALSGSPSVRSASAISMLICQPQRARSLLFHQVG